MLNFPFFNKDEYMFSDKNIDVFPNSGGFKRGFSVIIQYQKPTELPGD